MIVRCIQGREALVQGLAYEGPVDHSVNITRHVKLEKSRAHPKPPDQSCLVTRSQVVCVLTATLQSSLGIQKALTLSHSSLAKDGQAQ